MVKKNTMKDLLTTIVFLLLFSCSNCSTCQDECYYCAGFADSGIVCSSMFPATVYKKVKVDILERALFGCKKIRPRHIKKICNDDQTIKILENDSSYFCQ